MSLQHVAIDVKPSAFLSDKPASLMHTLTPTSEAAAGHEFHFSMIGVDGRGGAGVPS